MASLRPPGLRLKKKKAKRVHGSNKVLQYLFQSRNEETFRIRGKYRRGGERVIAAEIFRRGIVSHIARSQAPESAVRERAS